MKPQIKTHRKARMESCTPKSAVAPLLLFVLIAAFVALPYSRDLRAQTKPPAKGKSITLFDGKSMANWIPQGREVNLEQAILQRIRLKIKDCTRCQPGG